MATSTFCKQFVVTPEKADEFVNEMTKKASPTLPSDFKSNLVFLSQDQDLKEQFKKVLNK